MSEENLPKKFLTTFTLINIILFIGTIVGSFYFFYYKKKFDFIVEVPCDISTEKCIVRDCTNNNDCPPNGFEEFKRYVLSASDFHYCENENCLQACESNKIECKNISCIDDPLNGESCSELVTNIEYTNNYE